jgi:hypothetical protein
MKTKLLTLSLALLSSISYAQQYTLIPDPNFEQVLIDQTIDSEGGTPDGQVLTSDIAVVTNLAFGSGLGITDLTGIEDFTALTRLVCAGNNIDILDLSNNLQLDEVNCANNGMSSLILPNSNLLRDLKCWNNNLTSIDVSNNIGLELFWCYNNDLINTLDISANTSLIHFQCHQNDIQTLLLPSSTTLTWVKCDFNSLSSLDVSGLPNLEYLNFIQNSIPSINLTNNVKLDKLFCTLSGLTGTLDLTNNTMLTRVDCDRNSITGLLLPTTNTLTQLWCYTNNLTALDASGLTGLQLLSCRSNPSLSSLLLPNTTTLSELYAWECNLSTLNFTNNTGLQYLDIGINKFTSLDISMLPALLEFYCNENLLSYLNIKNNSNDILDWMWAQDNPSLSCIQVDNVAQANNKTNWLKDGSADYNTTCTLGLEELDFSNVSIYPNPSTEKFYIDLKLEANYTLSNMMGQEVKKGFLVSGTNELDTESLSSGLYLLNLESANGKTTKKLVKE